jgi:hypothetical protein
VLGQVSAFRSDRCTAENGEADTYKVVGYVRWCARVLTGCCDDIDENPPMGDWQIHLVCSKETTQSLG